VAPKKGLELGVSVSGDASMSVMCSPSHVLPRSSLAKMAKSGAAPPVNLSPPHPSNGFVPERWCWRSWWRSVRGVVLSLLPDPASQGTSGPGATPMSSVQYALLPTLGVEGESAEWWRLQDGIEHVCSQLVLAREGFSAMLGQVDSELVALEREVVPLGRV
jgi:hypothetical protein